MAWDPHKRAAVDFHDGKVGDFAARYRALGENSYASSFTYGRKKIDEIVARTIAHLPPGTRALDAGCGTGFQLARLRARGFWVTGLEPSLSMRRKARAAVAEAEVAGGDIEEMPFVNACFDLVMAIEVLRYLAQPVRALTEMARVLRTGGIAIATAAPLLSIGGYALIHAVTSRMRVPTFQSFKQSFMTTRSARRAVLDAGFSSVEVHGAYLGPWLALERVSPRALGAVLRAMEPIDDLLSDHRALRDLANHLVIVARR